MRIWVAAVLASAVSVVVPSVAVAQADPYVDAVASGTTAMVVDPGNLLGAPDGQVATVNGQLGRRIVLDLGEGEEGVGDLLVYFNGRTLSEQTQLYFLTAGGATVATKTLTMIGLGPRVAHVSNTSPTPYRFIRIDAGTAQVFTFDAIETAALA